MFYYIKIFMAIYALLTLVLALVGTVSKLAAFASKLLIAYMIMCFCALYGVVAAIVLTPFGKNVAFTQWTVGRLFRWTLGPVFGVDFVVENEEGMWKDRPVVFLGNHQSELDILVLGRIFPQYCSVSAKSSLKHTPFLGWFMNASGAIFIDRANRTSALSAFDNAIKQMKSNRQSAWIFPEGTRSYSTEPMMLPFKKGAFHLAVQAQVPIVPVVVQNYSHVFNLKEKALRPGTIRIKVLDKIETQGIGSSKEEIDGLVERVRNLMVKELEAMGLGDKKRQ